MVSFATQWKSKSREFFRHLYERTTATHTRYVGCLILKYVMTPLPFIGASVIELAQEGESKYAFAHLE